MEEKKKSTPTSTGKAAVWVMAKYTGSKAKYVAGCAAQGIGYFVLDQPDQGDAWIEVAFRWPVNGPVPEHLTPVENPDLLTKLEDWAHGR